MVLTVQANFTAFSFSSFDRTHCKETNPDTVFDRFLLYCLNTQISVSPKQVNFSNGPQKACVQCDKNKDLKLQSKRAAELELSLISKKKEEILSPLLQGACLNLGLRQFKNLCCIC